MKKILLRAWVITKLVAIVASSWPYSVTAAEGNTDIAMIMELSPTAVISGDEVEVIAKVAYRLEAHDTAVISLGFNTLTPNQPDESAAVRVQKGMGEVAFRTKIRPRFWSDTVPFGAIVGMFPIIEGERSKRALSIDRVNLKISNTNERETAKFWPKASTVYVDGLSIVSITPDFLTEGVAEEIVLKVKYELFSREEGEIVVAASDGRPGRRRNIGATRVKIGKGEVEIRTKLNPKKTANLPLARLLVLLTEYPHGTPAKSLAWDEITVGVK